MSEEKFQGSQVAEVELEKPAPVTFPEGGLRAWLTVLGAWLVQFCTYGYTNAIGVYQDFYVRQYMNEFTSSEISWIGGVQTMLLFSVGLVAGGAFDRGYFYHLMIGGTILYGFSLFMLSLSHSQSYYQVFLSQGLGVGLAFGMTYIPSLAIVGHYFRQRRALAMGIAASGSSIGGVVHPILLNHLFHGTAGFHVGVRASAGLNFGLMVIGVSLMRTRLPSKKASAKLLPQLRAFLQDPPYVIAITGGFLNIIALLFPYFFIQLDAITRGMEPNFAFYTLVIMNGASTIGRILAGGLAIPLGVYNLIITSLPASAILILCMLHVHNVAGFVTFSVLFGLTSGVFISLFAPMLAMLAKDVSEIGARMGICYAVFGIAALISAPINGALLSADFTWRRPIIFSGVCMVVGSGLLAITRHLVWKRRSMGDSNDRNSQVI